MRVQEYFNFEIIKSINSKNYLKNLLGFSNTNKTTTNTRCSQKKGKQIY